MSSLTVRQVIQDELETYLASASVNFVETVNIDSGNTPNSPWATVSFTSYGNENFSFEAGKGRETGAADIYVYVRAGQGDSIAVGIADGLAIHFNGFSSGDVVVVNVAPPNEATAGQGLGGWYGVLVSLDYQYYY